MKDEILTHLNDPRHLEKIYRSNKTNFKRAFSSLYPELRGNTLADFWNERLNYETDEINWGSSRELILLVFASILAGVIAKLPSFLPVSAEFFYPRNIGFIIFPILCAFFAWQNKLSHQKIGLITLTMLAGLIFINFLPTNSKSDTLTLSCIHLLLLLWALLGVAFVGDAKNSVEKRLGYLRYNGDLIVMTTLILIAGGIMSAITIGLFTLIGFQIESFYFKNVIVFGLPAAPILGTYLTQANPQLVSKVSPVIAKIFTPLVLAMLAIYLVAIIYSGKNPYNDREFLLIFNGLLVGVMALIFFSVAESTKGRKSQAETWVLALLCLLTIVVNSVALTAILFRIREWGITPNRVAVLGSNILFLINLVLIMVQLYRVASKKAEITKVGITIASYLPVYCIWAMIVTFFFPLVFGFR